uniref:Fructose-2,6-bisphosphatase TIGAR n=1 Tax=Trichobilharzia regenti TaxID=157069 RepID=A0AA85ISM0_TRIRE|nr:unnamed protein product [Trichobilharzia regenti]
MRQEILYFYVTLLRHGETTENKNRIIQGHLDTDLSDNGYEQARNVRTFINQSAPDIVISSDLKRARFTAYELASRTHDFLLDLCFRLLEKPVIHTDNRRQVCFPIIGSTDVPRMEDIITKNCTVFPKNGTEIPSINYAGHILIVSHGGWIRQFLRLLAYHSKYKQDFPKQCISSVMNNCGICQVGIAFDVESMKMYQKCPPDSRSVFNSPLPVFGSTMVQNGTSTSGEKTDSCKYICSANPMLPIMAVCYRFNVTGSLASLVQDHNVPSTLSNNKESSHEENFPRYDENEYAGQSSSK